MAGGSGYVRSFNQRAAAAAAGPGSLGGASFSSTSYYSAGVAISANHR